ncbi:MAG: conserved hypothetical transcriptional regulator, LysR family [Rhodoferax sp.]|nr:conserved hypothetical transcriptional regulator, LysR family [Rhodoferax sp.]
MLNLRAIQILVAVVDTGSITKAAASLGITQPAVSMALHELERGVGIALLDRSTRPLRPTHAGYALYHRAAGLMSDVASLRAVVTSAAADRVPLLRIGCVIPFNSRFVRRLQQMANEIEIRSGLTPDLLQALHARDLDVVVTSSPEAGPAGLHRIRLVSEPFVAVLPRSAGPLPDDAAALPLALLRQLAVVRYTGRSAIARAIEGILRHLGLELPEHFEFHTSQAVLTTVDAGLGWAISTPICIAQCGFPAEAFRLLPLPDVSARRTLAIVHRRDEFEPTVEKIRALVIEHLDELVSSTFKTSPWIGAAMHYG